LIRVSIVTISFNQASFLERTIQSVLNQDYSNIEYIVVDPGSRDGSRELIRRYESRIAKTILDPDKGPADGLNKGFAAATGEIFGFLNSDDVFYPGTVSAAVRFLSSHPKIDVVSGNAKVIGPDDHVLRLVYSDRMFLKGYIYGGVILIQPSTFFRRSAYQQTKGFNLGNRATWDGELFFDMARAGCRFGRSQDIWSGFRLHTDSITVSKELEEARIKVQRDRFQRVIGRLPNRWDKCLEQLFRLWKHVANPRDAMERVMRGPIFGRRELN
jgi:glycosyltransferase involved in cell wall biosynthesis